ncbi:uncharacterized protein LOC115617801 isoform X1 [Strigops habroptila]|uniref:uncharacterized protein LOC115617801 isoform X1 n=1 Tax=Strigops habroptila TaxID=2489341 RepID=UPI0011D00F51|nr:uncharacterized protein LOC115617801 isoform X1 [Strigops habroptila]
MPPNPIPKPPHIPPALRTIADADYLLSSSPCPRVGVIRGRSNSGAPNPDPSRNFLLPLPTPSPPLIYDALAGRALSLLTILLPSPPSWHTSTAVSTFEGATLVGKSKSSLTIIHNRPCNLRGSAIQCREEKKTHPRRSSVHTHTDTHAHACRRGHACARREQLALYPRIRDTLQGEDDSNPASATRKPLARLQPEDVSLIFAA